MIQIAANQQRNILGVEFNDWYIDSNGDLVTCSGTEAIMQSVTAQVWLCLGDYDFNKFMGVPWVQLFSKEPFDYSLLNYHLKQAILSTNDFIPASERPDNLIRDDFQITYRFDKDTNTLNAETTLYLNNGQSLKMNLNPII